MYVAITRARERLWLTRSRSRYLYGRREQTVRSEFVDELKDELGIEDTKARYGGDFGDEDGGGYGYGYSARRSYGGYGGYGSGYQSSAPRRVGRASDDEGFRTYGSGKAVSKSVPARSEKKAPVRFGNVGVTSSTASQTAQKAAGKDLSGYKEGVKVRHPRFGEGVVTGVRGAGSNVIVTVRFDTAGNKDLAAALAPLEIVG